MARKRRRSPRTDRHPRHSAGQAVRGPAAAVRDSRRVSEDRHRRPRGRADDRDHVHQHGDRAADRARPVELAEAGTASHAAGADRPATRAHRQDRVLQDGQWLHPDQLRRSLPREPGHHDHPARGRDRGGAARRQAGADAARRTRLSRHRGFRQRRVPRDRDSARLGGPPHPVRRLRCGREDHRRAGIRAAEGAWPSTSAWRCFGLALHVFITYQAWIVFVARMSLRTFWRGVRDPVLYAMGAASSLATLPVTLGALRRWTSRRSRLASPPAWART